MGLAQGSARFAAAAAFRPTSARESGGRAFEPDLGEQFGDARRTLAARQARSFEGERDIALRSAPRQQRIGVILENDGDVARWRALGAAAVGHGADVACNKPAISRSSVVLPQPDGPTTQTNRPR